MTLPLSTLVFPSVQWAVAGPLSAFTHFRTVPGFWSGFSKGPHCCASPCLGETGRREGAHISKVAQMVLATRWHFQQVHEER